LRIGGLNRFNRKTGKFTRYIHDPNDPYSLGSDDVLAIYEDQAGTLWIATFGGGLNRYDREKEQFTIFMHDPDNPHSLIDDRVLTILEDHEGVLWVGTVGGLDRFESDTKRFTHYQNDPDDPYSLSNDIVLSVIEDRSGLLWIGTNGGGLNRFDRSKNRFIHYQNEPDDPHSLSFDEVWTIHEDREGVLWVGTHGGGLERFNLETEQFTHYKNDLIDSHSLSDNEVWSIYEDQGGVFWIGTFGGLNKFNPQTARFNHFRADPNTSNSLSENRVWSIYEDRYGTLWVGTYGGGLNRFDRHSGNWHHYQNDPEEPYSLSSNVVRSVYQDSKGVIWIGTNEGLNRFDDEREQFERFQHDPADPCSLTPGNVWPILEDQEGTLWVGTWGGLNSFDSSTGCFIHYLINADDPASLDNMVWAIHESHSGILWLGTGAGLVRFDPESDQFNRYQHNPDDPNSLSSDSVFTIHEDQSGVLWIGTWGGGLNRFDPVQETFTHYWEKDGLANDVVYGILEDEQGNLWLSTNRGLSRFNPEKGAFKNYDSTYGLQSDEFNNGAYHKSGSGEMFFGGINGFNAFYPEQIVDNSHIPPMIISTFKKFNQTVRTDLPPGEHILLSYKENFISFEFAALDYTAPERNKYAYKMEGLDQDWVYIGTQQHADYRNLQHGEYIFRVKGSNNDGIWNEVGTWIHIKVTPPFWVTWWFRGIVTLTFVGVAFGGLRLRIRNLQARSRELEKQVEERTVELRQEISQRTQAEETLRQREREKVVGEERNRLARDLHDSAKQEALAASFHLDTALTLFEHDPKIVKNHLVEADKLIESVRRELTDLIHELRPSSMNGERFDETINEYLVEWAHQTGIGTNLDVTGFVDLSLEIKQAIYRIMQEALANVARHSSADQATVAMEYGDSCVKLSICDNGKGFDTQQHYNGIGLESMRERAESFNGDFQIESETDQGTKIIVTFPIEANME